MKDDVLKTLIKFLVVGILWDFLLFNLGRIALLVCTVGRYPRSASENDADRIALVGAAVLVLI